MTTREFTVAELEALDVRYENRHQELIDQKRWTNVYTAVFEHEGVFWQVKFQEGATESQELSDAAVWMHRDPVTAVEVATAPVITMVWLPTPDDPMDTDDPLITVDEIAEALTAGDNDFNETLEGWLSMGAMGPVISGTFKADDELNPGDGDNTEVEWHAVVALGPAPKAGV